MTPERWGELKELVASALALPEAEREAFVRGRAAEDPELGDQAVSLLASANLAASFLSAPAIEAASSILDSIAEDRRAPIPRGARFGPYEIVALIGAGGMGEVYRARDERLKREVAVKVLPALFTQNPDRMRRFEQEARAAGSLNHPNILAIYDVGAQEGIPYVVSELLEGETLRRRILSGALPPRKAIDYAIQVAHGLAAAHEKGIVHRDLKPENLFVTKDGRVKILDFGLAKITRPDVSSLPASAIPTTPVDTEPGVVMGTVGYMSPEQVRGEPAGARSDIFSLGAILYEMLSGKRAFRGDSAADTMSAILHQEPPELSGTRSGVAPELDRIVRRSLEKNPEQRFQSARDLAWNLENLSAVSGASRAGATGRAASRTWLVPGLAAAALLALAAAAYFAWSRRALVEPQITVTRASYRPGYVVSARFDPRGRTILFSEAVEGRPIDVFAATPPGREARSLGLSGRRLASISSDGELAVLETKRQPFSGDGRGTLARLPQSGGSPREILEDVLDADWGPRSELAVVRWPAGSSGTRIEYPIGTRLYETKGFVGYLRVSSTGEWVAFLETDPGSSVPSLRAVDRRGRVRDLFKAADMHRPAWSPDGSEVLVSVSGNERNENHSIEAVDLRGRRRTVLANGMDLILADVAPDGRLLATRTSLESGMRLTSPDGRFEKEISWFDSSVLIDISAAGDVVLFQEGGGAIGVESSGIFLRKTDGSPATRIGDGEALALSPDGRWALTNPDSRRPELLQLLQTGAGEARPIQISGAKPSDGQFLPDSSALLVVEDVEQGPRRVWSVDLASGKTDLLPARVPSDFSAVAPDGLRVIVSSPDGGLAIFPLRGGAQVPLPGTEGRLHAMRWSGDGRYLFLSRSGIPYEVLRYEIATSRLEPWATLRPSNVAAVTHVGAPSITPDGRLIGYGYLHALYSEVVLIEGLERRLGTRRSLPGGR